jgi:hypothetical protein
LRIHVTFAENSAPWELSMELFVESLARYRADARPAVRTQGTGEYAAFDLDLGGEPCHGGYFPDQQLILDGGSIRVWAPVIEWFLGLLPFDARADTFLEPATVPRDLPRTATAADIARILAASQPLR